jgi:hypothetical protein
MSYNGSGTFNINTTGQPVVAGTVITATAFNLLTADLATGLTTAITKDGQTATTARIPFAQGINSTLVTDSTNTTSGSIITAGGVGIAKALYVGTTANVTGVATFSAQPIFSSLTASSAVATDASKGLVSVTNTGTGNNVLATAPTIASLNLTTALTIASAAGTAGQALTSGGSGNAPTWTTIAATPGGSTTQLQYNNAGAFGGISGVTTDGTRMTASTTIGVGGATPSTSGAGISFPASQSASSDANTLDDYEEGTWTPTDGSGASLSFTSVEATYTKIGRFAFFDFQVVYPSTASGADTRINGFPFNNIDNYEGKPGVCLVSGFLSGYIQQKQGTNYGFIVNSSSSNVTNIQASTRTARGAQYYATT